VQRLALSRDLVGQTPSLPVSETTSHETAEYLHTEQYENDLRASPPYDQRTLERIEAAEKMTQAQPQSECDMPNMPFLSSNDYHVTDMEQMLEPVQAELNRLKNTTFPLYNHRLHVKSRAQVLKERLLPVGRHILSLLKAEPEGVRGGLELKFW
jgi:hypothetical protein